MLSEGKGNKCWPQPSSAGPHVLVTIKCLEHHRGNNILQSRGCDWLLGPGCPTGQPGGSSLACLAGICHLTGVAG